MDRIEQQRIHNNTTKGDIVTSWFLEFNPEIGVDKDMERIEAKVMALYENMEEHGLTMELIEDMIHNYRNYEIFEIMRVHKLLHMKRPKKEDKSEE